MGPAEAARADPLNVKARYRKTRDRYDTNRYAQQILECGLKWREIAAMPPRVQNPFARVGSVDRVQRIAGKIDG